MKEQKSYNWYVTLELKNMPPDADNRSIEILVHALLGNTADTCIQYEIVSTSKRKENQYQMKGRK